MPGLSPRQYPRIFSKRQWACTVCLKFQIKRHTSSLAATLSGPRGQGPLDPTPIEPPPTESIVRKSKAEINASRLHLKNRGQYYVTTPIFYVNGDPHVGHMHSMIVADVHKRFKQLWRKDAVLSTGTDEYGMKVQKAALAKGEEPLQFCTTAAEKFKDLTAKINMSKHVFIRTTQPEHKIAVQHLWKVLEERGHIYKGKHEGWYSVTDECFYKESQIEDRHDSLGTTQKVSKETGSTVEWTSEENYCFRLSDFQEKLKEHYRSYPTSIVPKTYYHDVLRTLEDGLEDISISRPSSRLSWGIEVPGDPDQTIYVWFDALVNYLTVTGYPWSKWGKESEPSSDGTDSESDTLCQSTTEPIPEQESNQEKTFQNAVIEQTSEHDSTEATSTPVKTTEFSTQETTKQNSSLDITISPSMKKAEVKLEVEEDSVAKVNENSYMKENAWPADLHVIGKDIVRFHCIFWPAFLLAAQLSLPRQILVHGHWTQNGLKMSKSLGNVVSPHDVLKTFHPDVIRYYMMKEGGQERDGNWSQASLRNRYTYLCNTWGNLISRMMSPKMDLQVAVLNVFDNGVYRGIYSFQPEQDEHLRNAIESATDVYRYCMNNLNLDGALNVVDNLWRAGNQYVTAVKPWLYNTTDAERLRFYSIQHQVGEVMRIGAIFAQPFMPVKAAEILDVLGVSPARRDLRFAMWGADFYYGKTRQKGAPPVHIFPRMEEIESGATENMEELMRRRKAEKLALKEKKRRMGAERALGRSNQSYPGTLTQKV